MSKPTESLEWVKGGNQDQLLKPDAGLENTGYSPSEQPDARHFNWVFKNLYSWISYLDSIVTNLGEAQTLYDAYVGGGGTHADFNALMADSNIANIKRVFVRRPIALDATQVINTDDIEIVFAAGASITKVTGTTKAFQLTGNKIRFKGARFDTWASPGDVCIEQTATSKNNLVSECLFYNCVKAIQDDGTNNTQLANVEEV